MANFRYGGGRRRSSKYRGGRPRVCPFCADKIQIDYKDTALLARFIQGGGKIASRHKSRACSKHQRRLAHAIKRARFLALLPYGPSHIWKTGWTASATPAPTPAPAPAAAPAPAPTQPPSGS